MLLNLELLIRKWVTYARHIDIDIIPILVRVTFAGNTPINTRSRNFSKNWLGECNFDYRVALSTN